LELQTGGVTLEGIRLETKLTDFNGINVLDVTGEIDVYTAPKFKEAINSVLSMGQNHLIINLAEVTYMDSSGFGALLSATKRLRPIGGTVNLVKCSGSINRILQITRLNTVFNTYDSIDEAVEAVKKA